MGRKRGLHPPRHVAVVAAPVVACGIRLMSIACRASVISIGIIFIIGIVVVARQRHTAAAAAGA